jgi:hypothetical protein
MYSDNELLKFLMSQQKDVFAKAINRQLIEIERFFGLDITSFLAYTNSTEAEFFSHNSGAVQLWFEDKLNHPLAVYGEQLSIVLLPEILSETEFDKCYKLSEINGLASKELINCLGKVCKDVRIWTLWEDFESEEAKEVAVSYLLSNGQELFYCIYLHEDLDSDYLLVDFAVPQEKVASCFSLALGDYIDLHR